MPPFAPMPPHAPKPMRQRMMNRMGALKDAFPKWLSQYSIVVYILALAVVSFMYSSHSLPWYYMLSGVVAVIVFFLYGGSVTKETSIEKIRKSQRFERRIFFIAFIPRVVFMLLLYQIFMANYGDSLGFENMDALYYDELGTYVAGLIKKGNFHFYDEISSWSGSSDVADMGYGVYVGFIYWLTGNSIIVVRLLKCLLSSITVLLVYRLAKRNFGDQTARVAAIFCALWPNFWYYCAIHLKETEMVFLAVLFVEQADQMLRSKQFTAWKVIPVLLIAATIFTFRTPLGVVSLLALIFSVIMSSTRVVSWGKRIIVGLLAVLLIGVTAGNRIQEQSQALYEQARGGVQQENMEWRTKRDNGNAFAKYAGKTVFAPLIFTIPFPSMVRPYDGQDVQQINNGGNFVKNIVSCFTIFAMIMLLMSGKWREHILPLSFVLGYLVVLTMSMFAQSERFHQPIMPFEFMFAAYGLSIAVTKPKYKRWFTYWCALIFVACIVWNWFKMAGRGLA
jgi:4-amino-4-deoxy-L-arabinose transferase-like glycosyltransferase